ncbi:TPA: hypothetical protein ACHUB4_004737 [Escherichia coli]|uniref:hypothetical protein n=1 Tax=Escherichia coli TaxID=562 RepID=UPI000BE34739|nr:hypothetical protein [Escherichia coli]MBS9316431.1 hypothetical protein [Escherichia coli]
MGDFIGNVAQRIAPLEFIQNDHTKNVVQKERRNVQSVMTLAAEKGGLSMMFDKQSLRTDHSRAMSAALKRNGDDVEGGGDITGADIASSGFINVLGDMNLVALNNKLTVTLTKAEADVNKAAAQSSARVVNAAERAGNKSILAARQRLNGAITSGVMGMVAHGATTTATLKALSKESKSITNNLGGARELDKCLRENQSTIKSSSDNMLSEGKQLDSNVEHMMSHPHAETMHESSVLTDKHANIQLSTRKVHTTTEFANQTIHSGREAIQGNFEVDAAKESKQVDLARADQNVNSEVSNTQQQTAKKAAEAKSSLQQVFEATLNNNNSAVSAIAERMR